jgi:hypothetical protein
MARLTVPVTPRPSANFRTPAGTSASTSASTATSTATAGSVTAVPGHHIGGNLYTTYAHCGYVPAAGGWVLTGVTSNRGEGRRQRTPHVTGGFVVAGFLGAGREGMLGARYARRQSGPLVVCTTTANTANSTSGTCTGTPLCTAAPISMGARRLDMADGVRQGQLMLGCCATSHKSAREAGL